MVIDSSALLVLLLDEPEADRLTAVLAADPVRCISAFSLLETSVVLYRRKGAEAVAELDALLADLGVEIVAFDAIQARAARFAYGRFGKDCIQPHSTSATAAHTLWRGAGNSPCSTKATTSLGPMSPQLSLCRRLSQGRADLTLLISPERSGSAPMGPDTVRCISGLRHDGVPRAIGVAMLSVAIEPAGTAPFAA